MKWVGGLMMFVAISAVAQFADLKPDPEQAWVRLAEALGGWQEKYPDVEPYSVRFTDLHRYITELPGFVGDPMKSTESILEAIQSAWNEEYEDAK